MIFHGGTRKLSLFFREYIHVLIHARYIPPDDSHLLCEGRSAYQQARKAAAGLLNAARRRRSRHFQHAFEKGLEQGRSEGFKEGLITAQARALESHAALVSSIKDAQDDCVSLVFELAREIFGTGAAVQHGLVTAKVEELINGMLRARPLVIEVSPSQAENVKKDIESDLKDPHIRVVPGESIACGNARIITEAGSIELDWQSHLNLLKESYAGRDTAHSEG